MKKLKIIILILVFFAPPLLVKAELYDSSVFRCRLEDPAVKVSHLRAPFLSVSKQKYDKKHLIVNLKNRHLKVQKIDKKEYTQITKSNLKDHFRFVKSVKDEPNDWSLVDLKDGVDPLAAKKELEEKSDIDVELNYIVSLAVNDPLYHSYNSVGQCFYDQYYLRTINRGFSPEVDQSKIGEGIVISVIDTGVDYKHEDLKDIYWINSGEKAGNGIDDDGNGYVDDYIGYDFVNNDNDPMDDHTHGTHIAGIIAANTNNMIGISGIAPGIKLQVLKAFDSTGNATILDISRALNYAIRTKVDILNLSFSFEGTSRFLDDILRTAKARGVLAIGAAGNNNDNVSSYFPGNSTQALVVGATDRLNNKATFSNYGENVDIAAPGDFILSTASANKQKKYGLNVDKGKYVFLSGTSFAVPIVSAIAAILKAENKNLNLLQLTKMLLDYSKANQSISSRPLGVGIVKIPESHGLSYSSESENDQVSEEEVLEGEEMPEESIDDLEIDDDSDFEGDLIEESSLILDILQGKAKPIKKGKKKSKNKKKSNKKKNRSK